MGFYRSLPASVFLPREDALKKHLQMIQQILNTQAIALHVKAGNTQLDVSFRGRTFQNLKVVSLGSPPRALPAAPASGLSRPGKRAHLGLEEPALHHCRLY